MQGARSKGPEGRDAARPSTWTDAGAHTAKSAAHRPTLLLALLIPLLGGGTYLAAERAETDQAHTRFESYLAMEAGNLEGEFRACLESLFALRALYESSEDVTREEFATFANDACSRNPTLRALEWIPRVTHAQRLQAASGTLAPEDSRCGLPLAVDLLASRQVEDREVYFPVTYVEPLEGNEAALGFELGRERERAAVLRSASEVDVPVMTGPLDLVQDDGEGVLVLLALHANGSGPPSDPRGLLRGFLALVFVVEDVIEAALAPTRSDIADTMSFVLLDVPAQGPPRLLHASPGAADREDLASSSVRQDLALAGRTWRLQALPGRAFLDRHRTGRPLLLGLIALLLSGFLYGALLVFARRASERASRSHELTVTSVLESLDDAVLVADEQGRARFANAAAQAVVGPLPEGAGSVGRAREWGLLESDGVTPYEEQNLPLARALRGEHVVDQSVLVRNPQHPTGRWFSVNAVPLHDEEGGRRGGIVVARDVTHSRAVEEHLQRLSRAVEQTADAVMITDREGTIEYVNPAFTKVTGFPAEEALGKTPRILKSGHHGDAFYRALWDRILSGQVHHGTTINRRKRGGIYYAEQTITPMRNEHGEVTHFVSSLKDMTDVRKREEHAVELRLAGRVQQRLYPQSPPAVPGLDIAGVVVPAEAACGDYFDYIALPCGQLALAVGDVSGHGLGPALVMAETRAYLRAYLGTGAPPAAVFGDLNRTLEADLASDGFVTLILVCFDAAHRSLTWTNAGHAAALVLDRTGRVKAELGNTGAALGVLPECVYRTDGPLALDEGDVILLLTDGITETRGSGGLFFSEDLVLAAVRRHLQGSADDIRDSIFAAMSAFAGGRPSLDDQTLVVCKVVGDGAAAPTPSATA